MLDVRRIGTLFYVHVDGVRIGHGYTRENDAWIAAENV